MPRGRSQSAGKSKWLSRRRAAITIWVVACLAISWKARSWSHLYFSAPNPTIDYIALATKRSRAVPGNERAWPLYRNALIRLKQHPRYPWPGGYLVSEDGGVVLADADEMRSFYEEERGAIDQLLRAAQMPSLGFVSHYGVRAEDRVLWPPGTFDDDRLFASLIPSVADALLPHLTDLEAVAKIFQHEAADALQRSQSTRYVDTTVSALGIARHAAEDEMLISRIVALTQLQTLSETIARDVIRNPSVFTRSDLQRLKRHLSEAPIEDLLRADVVITHARFFFEDLVQQIYTDDGKGDGRLSPWSVESLERLRGIPRGAVASPLLSPLASPTRGEVMSAFDEIQKALVHARLRPMWEWEDFSARAERRRVSPPSTSRWSIDLTYVWGFRSQIFFRSEYARQVRDAALVAIACAEYKLERSRWPISLDELLPIFLQEIPRDRFDGAPLRYALQDGDPVLYSVGTNRVDDGGTPEARWRSGEFYDDTASYWLGAEELADQQASSSEFSHDGDWILWRANRLDPETGETYPIDK